MANDRRILVVFVDALGPTQLDRADDALAFLPHRRALRGILGYSSGALPTILTGAPPNVHGRMCLFSIRRDGEPSILAPLSWLRLLPRALHERGPLRRYVAKGLAWARGLTGYVALHRVPPSDFQWLDLPERDDMFKAETVGSARTFLADARRAGLSVFAADWRVPEAERIRRSIAEIERSRPDLSFLYATELDAALHEKGNHEGVTHDVLRRIAASIQRAREALAQGGARVTTLLVGDHGMADVNTFIDPRPILADLGRARAFVDSTMLRLWGDDASLSHARSTLERSTIPGQWLDEDALRSRLAPTKDAPYGRAIWLLPEGAIFSPSFVGGRARGMHGYDIADPSAFAALASDDPAALECSSLTDIGALVRAGLGLTTPSMTTTRLP